jgi:hypothetical protein
MKKYNEENRELYELLSNYSGSNITNPKEVNYLMDDLFIEVSVCFLSTQVFQAQCNTLHSVHTYIVLT